MMDWLKKRKKEPVNGSICSEKQIHFAREGRGGEGGCETLSCDESNKLMVAPFDSIETD